jgi:hypothetical protein
VEEVISGVKDFGFPIVAAMGMLYMIYFVWKTITTKIESSLEETHMTLIGLIDRIRMLDNDIIRLQQKLDTAIEVKGIQEKENDKKD